MFILLSLLLGLGIGSYLSLFMMISSRYLVMFLCAYNVTVCLCVILQFRYLLIIVIFISVTVTVLCKFLLSLNYWFSGYIIPDLFTQLFMLSLSSLCSLLLSLVSLCLLAVTLLASLIYLPINGSQNR